jgi:ecotin
MAGTLIAPEPGAEKVDRFVTLGGKPYLIRYNSKLPVVVYVPEGFEVRYRIWRADPEGKAVEKG